MTERTLSRTPELRVLSWVEKVTSTIPSVLEFGAGVFTYTKTCRAFVRAGIESFKPYCDEAMADPECSTLTVIHGDMRDFASLASDSFFMALFIDSLEHISKPDGLTLLLECQERFKRIAVFVPMGEHPQDACDDNDAQCHLSSWYPLDLSALGFEVDVQPNFHHANEEGRKGAMFALWEKP